MRKDEIDTMTMGDYYRYNVVLNSVLKLWHAPFMPHDD
jgi:hypothetical protein